MRITIFVDADHACDKVTCRYVSGILVLMNNTVVKTFSKRQTTVESSTYGSELVAARLPIDQAVELIYTLQMIGVPIDGRRAGSLDHFRAHLIRNLTLQLSRLERMLEVVRESHADVEVDDVSEVNSVELKRERG